MIFNLKIMKIAFFEVESWEKEYLKGKLPGHELVFFPNVLDKDNLPQDAEIISGFTGSKFDQPILQSLPSLKFIATRTTGFDHIDLQSTVAKNILVSNVPAYGDNTVAEHTFGLLLSISKRICQSYERIHEEGEFDFTGLQGFDLLGKTIGVIGTGRIGQCSIKIANGFGMKVVAFDAFPRPELENELNFKYLSLEELLKTADIITIHVPYLPSTHHLINQSNLNTIKKGCVLINTARGAVVETEALIKGLQEGIFSGAGLDVLEDEGPLKNEIEFLLNGHPDAVDLKMVLQDHILMKMDNVIITPHNAFNTKEAVKRILDTTIENILKFIEGAPQNLVEDPQKNDQIVAAPATTMSNVINQPKTVANG